MSVQLNCCGVEGPQDYVHSSWFNHTREMDGIFVPTSCCALVPRRSVLAINENFCQVAAILYPVSLNKSNFLYTKVCIVHFSYNILSARCLLRLLVYLAYCIHVFLHISGIFDHCKDTVIRKTRHWNRDTKRGIATASRLPVCLSVTLRYCDRKSWNTSKIISFKVS